MSRGRKGIDRWNRQLGTWTPVGDPVGTPTMTEQDIQNERLVARALERVARQEALVRVHHPAIPAPSYKCYLVVRDFIMGDILCLETIGAFKTADPAMAMLLREKGRARVLDPNNKVYSDNLQPTERR